MDCKYLKIRKLCHNNGDETITYKCDNPKSNRFEKRSFCKNIVCDLCSENAEKGEKNTWPD